MKKTKQINERGTYILYVLVYIHLLIWMLNAKNLEAFTISHTCTYGMYEYNM